MRTPIHICEQRDPKGLYKKARAGLIKQFTGAWVRRGRSSYKGTCSSMEWLGW